MDNKLKIAIQSGRTFDYLTNDKQILLEGFKLVKECGFEAIDYGFGAFVKGNPWKGEYDDFYDKDLDELYAYFAPTKEAAEEVGIEFCQTHGMDVLYVDGDEDFNRCMFTAIQKNIALTAFLGAPCIVVHPYVCLDKVKQEQVNFDMYRRLIPVAKKYKVKLCLENLSGTHRFRYLEGVCSSAEEVSMYVDTLNKEAGEELFGFCLDIGHANVHAKNINWFIKKLGNRITCLHIHDNNGVQDNHMIPFTQIEPGTDWEGFVSGLRSIHYEGALSFETFNGLCQLPDDAKTEGLKLISAIGRYFKKRITE